MCKISICAVLKGKYSADRFCLFNVGESLVLNSQFMKEIFAMKHGSNTQDNCDQWENFQKFCHGPSLGKTTEKLFSLRFAEM